MRVRMCSVLDKVTVAGETWHAWQWQERPDVSANELGMGAVVLRNLIGEISAPPSAITPFASSNEIFFLGGEML